MTFSDPTESLTIQTGFNAAATDEHVYVDAMADFNADLIIDTGSTNKNNDGPDTVLFRGDVLLHGHQLAVGAETIEIQDGVTVSTSNAGGVAGAISLTGFHITLGASAALLAQGATPGAIAISAVDGNAIWTPELNIDLADVDVTIGANAKVKGGDVTILATADSRHILDSQNIVTTMVDKVANVIQGLTQIGAGMSVAQSKAHINVAAGSEFVASTFPAYSSAVAHASTAPITFMVGPALGIAITDAEVNFAGSLTATGDATIRSTTDNLIDVLFDTSGLKGIAASLAVSVVDTTATVTRRTTAAGGPTSRPTAQSTSSPTSRASPTSARARPRARRRTRRPPKAPASSTARSPSASASTPTTPRLTSTPTPRWTPRAA